MTQKAVRRITKFDFGDEGSHVALVDAAANEQTVAVMKSTTPHSEDSNPQTPNEENDMTVKTELTPDEALAKATAEVKAEAEAPQVDAELSHDIKKEIVKAKRQAELEAKAEIEKAKAAAKAEVEAAKAEVEELRKSTNIELLKGFVRKAVRLAPFKGDVSEHDFAKALMKVHGLGDEGKMVISALEKAADIHLESMSFEELGITLPEEAAPVSALQKSLEKQLGSKK